MSAAPIDDVPPELREYTQPQYPGAKWVEWTPAAYDRLMDSGLSCDICRAIPGPDGDRSHGRGCYVLGVIGGGYDDFDASDIVAALTENTE